MTRSLRARIFVALAASAMLGALTTGVYAILEDESSLGLWGRLASLTPKALVLAAILLPIAAAGAAIVGARLARPIEALTEAATRIAEGEHGARLPRGEGSEVRRLARALTSMRQELEGKPYAAAFLRDAWHDLKTPVAALRATLEILDDDALDDPATARRFVKNLRRSTDQLERTLADLVTLARYETVAMPPDRSAKMGDLVEEALARIAPLAEATRVTVDCDVAEAAGVRCDPAAIARAIGNLLENAVSATPGGRVAIAVSPAKGSIVMDMVNEPSAIPRDARRRLFDRAPKSGDGKGSGLGLAIVRAAIEAHGGTIRFVEMGPPRVCVRVELPR
ncbi:MAG: HAMP domain-containing protein [Labilithrix sp.]|nr:HAMP domain-containing protein [Labilithrix sp.]